MRSIVIGVLLLLLCSSYATAAEGDGIFRKVPVTPRSFYFSTAVGSGRGVRIALLDTGLDDAFPLASPNVRCISVVPGVLCGDAGFEHGTLSASVVGGHFTCGGARADCTSSPYDGIAPDAEILVIRVFDTQRESHVSYAVAALGAAEEWGAAVINLSFSSDDYSDPTLRSFIQRLTAKGVIFVVAAGNDGPQLGTVGHPGDMLEVITVGAAAVSCPSLAGEADSVSGCRSRVASFSARGPTTWELPFGAGRQKPDLLAVGEHVVGIHRVSQNGRLWERKATSGTSIAAPVVSGVIALCIEALRLSAAPPERVHVSIMKAILLSTARLLKPLHSEEQQLLKPRSKHASVRTYERYAAALAYSRYSQGAGVLEASAAVKAAREWSDEHPAVNVMPPSIGSSAFRPDDETFWVDWPGSAQGMFSGGPPTLVNVSVCAGLHRREMVTTLVSNEVRVVCVAPMREEGAWVPLVRVLSIAVSVGQEAEEGFCSSFSVLARVTGDVFTELLTPLCERAIVSGGIHVNFGTTSLSSSSSDPTPSLTIPFAFQVIAPPHRSYRVLFDTAHQWVNPVGSARGDEGYASEPLHSSLSSSPVCWVPGDDPHESTVSNSEERNLSEPSGGDHPHTNSALLFLYLAMELHLYVDFFPLVQHSVTAATEAEAERALQQNGVLLLADPELPLTPALRKRIVKAMDAHHLHLIVLGEWHQEEIAEALHPFLRAANASMKASSLCPFPLLAGGADIPSLNALLSEIATYFSMPRVLQFSTDVALDGVLMRRRDRSGSDVMGDPLELADVEPVRSLGYLNGAGAVVDTALAGSWMEGEGRVREGRAEVAACGLPGSQRYRVLHKQSDYTDFWRSSETALAVFGFMETSSNARVALFSDSNCFSDSSRPLRETVERVLAAQAGILLGTVSFAAYDDFIERLSSAESESATGCFEIGLELLRYVHSGEREWFCGPRDERVVTSHSSLNAVKDRQDHSALLREQLLRSSPYRASVSEVVQALLLMAPSRPEGSALATLEAVPWLAAHDRHTISHGALEGKKRRSPQSSRGPAVEVFSSALSSTVPTIIAAATLVAVWCIFFRQSARGARRRRGRGSSG